ncbi:MAG: sensor histidine kinase [Sphingobacterium sp.]
MTLIHIGFWIAYWCLELIKFSLISKIHTNTDLLIEILINLLCGTVFFYTLTLFVLPNKTNRIRVFQLVWRSGLALLLCMTLRRGSVLLMAEWADFKSSTVTNLYFFFVSNFDLCLKFGTYAVLIWFFRRQGQLQKQMLQKELDKEKLKHELLETKYAVLQAQINPHFLFNTLNFIHSKAISSDDQVIDRAVLLLSDILRHSLSNISHGDTIPVKDELAQIKNLYDLNCLRFAGKYYLNIVDEGLDFEQKIPPLILLTFFENMLKYGVFDDPKHPALLYVRQSNHLLEIRLENMINHEPAAKKQVSHALGKQYVKNMLDKYHESNYKLEYHNDGKFYQVNLKINER